MSDGNEQERSLTSSQRLAAWMSLIAVVACWFVACAMVIGSDAGWLHRVTWAVFAIFFFMMAMAIRNLLTDDTQMKRRQ